MNGLSRWKASPNKLLILFCLSHSKLFLTPHPGKLVLLFALTWVATQVRTLEKESVSRSLMSNSLQTPWTVALQAPLSIGFSRQEYWSGLPSSGGLPSPGMELGFPALQADSLSSEPPTLDVLKWLTFNHRLLLCFDHLSHSPLLLPQSNFKICPQCLLL